MTTKKYEPYPWSPELEQRLRYVESLYDGARGRGVDAVKLLLSSAVVIAGVPIVFYDRVLTIFSKNMILIHWSWILILLSIIIGFLFHFFIFEGYFHHAHRETCRWLLKDAQQQIEKNDKKSNSFFELAHICGFILIASFAGSLLFVCVAIYQVIF